MADLGFFGLIMVVVLMFIFYSVIKTWVRILNKLSLKAEQWVDNLDVTSSDD